MTDQTAERSWFGNDRKTAVHSAMEHRGWLINSYSQVEYMLADAVVRCRALPEYQHLPMTVPFQPTSRAPRFQKLLDSIGPLDSDKAALQGVLDSFVATAPRRHLLVHGFMSVEFIEPVGLMVLRFRKFEPTKEADDNVLMEAFSYEELVQVSNEAVMDAQHALNVFQQLHRRLGWEAPGIMTA